MKSYLPIAIILAVVVASGIAIRQYTIRQPSPSSSDVTIEASPTPKTETKSLVQGIMLTVSSPANNTTVTSGSLTVRGKTVAGAEVFANDAETRANASGNFSVKLTLDEGENYILVVANDANGNYAEKELTVTYAP